MTTNRVHAVHEQVRKAQVYALVEEPADVFDDGYRLRTCDLGAVVAGDRAARDALGRGLEEIGFVVLVNHGLDAALLDRATAAARALVEATPLAVKRRHVRPERAGSLRLGYFPLAESTRLAPDRVEGWEVDHEAFDLEGTAASARRAATFWPGPATEIALRPYYAAARALARPLMQAVLGHLGCDPHLYDARLASPRAALRINYYPPVGPADAASSRLVGHEDITLLSILPASPVEGLQIHDAARGSWIRVAAPPGSIILNAGDYLQRITNDVIRSCTHRVSLPRDRGAWTQPRVTIPVFIYLHEHEPVEVLPCFAEPRYPPIDALAFHTRTTAKFYGP